MYSLPFSNVKNLLCLGAHSDDIEIGCGASILKLLRQNPHVNLTWVVFSSTQQRKQEAIESANRFLRGAENSRIEIRDFPDRIFPDRWAEIKSYFGELCGQCSGESNPDLIFTHRLEDRHQDHRVISELTWNAFRDHWILEYEVPKYEGDLGQPNTFVPLELELVNQKIETLIQSFPSQSVHHWFEDETFRSLMRIRGLESNAKTKYAEAFYGRKTCIE